MKIVEGKYYRTARGHRVGPMRKRKSGFYEMVDDWDTPFSGSLWYLDGEGVGNEDLVEEWVEPVIIESGKYYRNRSGDKVGPAQWTGGEYPWNIPWNMGEYGKGDYFHYEDGRSCLGHKGDDIVGLWYGADDIVVNQKEPAMEYKTWGDMTPEEKGRLLLAHHEGTTIESKTRYGDSKWEAVVAPGWYADQYYRVKPEPKVETVEIEGACFNGAWRMSQTGFYGDHSHKITFDTIDGEPDCSSVKMEKITKDDDCPF